MASNERTRDLMRLLTGTQVLFNLYRTVRWRAQDATPFETRVIFDEHYRGQFELFDALARHVVALGGVDAITPTRIVRSTAAFDTQGRGCAAEHLSLLLAAHETVLAETRTLTRAASALRSGSTVEIVTRVAQANEIQRRFVADRLTARGRARS